MAHATPTTLGPTCRNCGTRHYAASRNNRICRGTLRQSDWAASAQGIAELAAQAREDGERHYGKYATTGSEWRLEQARLAYAKAAALEGVGTEQARLVARMGAGALRLRAAAQARRAA